MILEFLLKLRLPDARYGNGQDSLLVVSTEKKNNKSNNN